jgi:hypothetical protein
MSKPMSVEELTQELEVIDYATGAKGSYCIQRRVADNPAFVEFWNPSPNKWAGSGYVFTDAKLAHAVCGLLSGSKPRCLDCNSAGISNCSHFDNCGGRWMYAQRRG